MHVEKRGWRTKYVRGEWEGSRWLGSTGRRVAFWAHCVCVNHIMSSHGVAAVLNFFLGKTCLVHSKQNGFNSNFKRSKQWI